MAAGVYAVSPFAALALLLPLEIAGLLAAFVVLAALTIHAIRVEDTQPRRVRTRLHHPQT